MNVQLLVDVAGRRRSPAAMPGYHAGRPPRSKGLRARQLRPWLDARAAPPVGRLFCVIDGPTRGRPWAPGAVRTQLLRLAAEARCATAFRTASAAHGHAVEMAREGVPLNVIQRQLGHTDLGVTSVYLQRIDNDEVIKPFAAAPRR